MNCSAYRGVKLLEHGMKIVERILEKRIRVLVEVDDMQFGYMPERWMTDALFIVRRMQEEYREKDKQLYKCFMDLKKTFDRVPRRVKEERTTRDLGESSDESAQGYKDEN